MTFISYRRTQIAGMTPWVPGFDMTRVSVSASDTDNGSPKAGDMIARNPKNHSDQWLVAAAYFAENFEAMGCGGPAQPWPDRGVLAEIIHKARWPADRQMAVTPFADEDRSGREYCFRIADAILNSGAPQPRGESVQTNATQPIGSPNISAQGKPDCGAWRPSEPCKCSIMCQDLGEEGGCRYKQPARETLRRLVDIVYQHATESTAVPATHTADLLIDRAFGVGSSVTSTEGK